MKKIIFGIILIVILVAGAIFVLAQKGGVAGGPGFGHGFGPGGPGFGHGGPMIEMALRGLDLTDDQRAKVKEIMEASRTSVEPLMKQLHDNHKALADLGANGNFDQAKVEAIAADQGNITAKLIVEKEKAKAQVFALLTDEQKAKAAEMRQKFEQRFKEGKGFEGKRPAPGSEF